MLRVIDDEKEYYLGESGKCLMVQDLADPDDCVQVNAKDFSDFEVSVFKFLSDEE